MVAFAFLTPAVLLSGYASPVENMPDWLQWLAMANPMTHFIVISKAIFLKETSADLVLRHLWPMMLIGLVTLTAATWLFRRRAARSGRCVQMVCRVPIGFGLRCRKYL